GTAHYAWFVAASLDGHLAGIIGAGDGFSTGYPSVQAAMQMQRPVAYFGTAGTRDFNFYNAWRRHWALDDSPLPHRFVPFEGRHSWPPKALAKAAVEWMELQAVRSGFAEHSSAWLKALYAAALQEAHTLEQEHCPVDALRRYQEIVRDFDGLLPIDEAKRQARALADDKQVQKRLARQHEFAKKYDSYQAAVHDFIIQYRSQDPPPSHRQALRKLSIRSMQERAEDTAHPDRAAAAQRMLASAHTNLSFYGPRDFIAEKDYQRAAGLLRLAHAIYPTAPVTCYRLARAEAQLGRRQEALDALACAFNGRGVRPEQLATDSLLDPLRNESRFQEMVAAYTAQ
ncbi:MAG TPA: hypothetical protein VKP65_06405, partial [Rhodothermales bacterium]|nr:hypothetical protein [Rhodothermales bacterium]